MSMTIIYAAKSPSRLRYFTDLQSAVGFAQAIADRGRRPVTIDTCIVKEGTPDKIVCALLNGESIMDVSLARIVDPQP